MSLMEKIFTDIYTGNKFLSDESVSGVGSEINNTQVIINELPKLFSEFDIHTVLDIPCGDFNWMRYVDLKGIDYIGADIVGDLIEKNKKKHEKNNVKFEKLNLVSDKLPKVDLVLCRDCFGHFSYEDIFRAVNNIRDSGSKYLLTTTFPCKSNHDITTGMWRSVNLVKPPFGFPLPKNIINEKCAEEDGIFSDKSLGLWVVSDLVIHE